MQAAKGADVIATSVDSAQAFNKHYMVPRSPSAKFTGRQEICLELEKKCLPIVPFHSQKQQKRFVLHGLGGSGKTQIALKFAQDYRERYVYWPPQVHVFDNCQILGCLLD